MRAGEIDARGQIAPILVDRAAKRLLIHYDVVVTRRWRAHDRSGDASAVDARTGLIAGVAGPALDDRARAPGRDPPPDCGLARELPEQPHRELRRLQPDRESCG